MLYEVTKIRLNRDEFRNEDSSDQDDEDEEHPDHLSSYMFLAENNGEV